ncbi:FAD-dependent monooxygenase [Actinomadura algeriensis]|uniref:Salicylate hydroxylase n=1 Tax=Actinomadura algeriensis TaxID=1679523 RepID=A0ABR9JTK4_9ACTN|nr:FAD-dependent monooxygenase [Actinomadura algeriensis]MBE1533901.1 salicylate hydroxylase [Actinomadura algeriensis]
MAVLGAGIGGLTAAAALLRRGLDVQVYEQAGELREVGVGLHLGSNGARLLHRLGLGAELDRVAVRPAAMEVRSFGDGAVFARQPMGKTWEAEYGAPYYTVHRADLLAALAALIPPGRLALGRRCTGFEESDAGVRLAFADGTEATADVLVGADGVHSVVRRAVAGAQRPVFSGVTAYRGVVPAGETPSLARDTMFVWAGGPSRLLAYPVSGGRLFTFVAVVPDGGAAPESWSATGSADEVVRALAAGEPAVREIAAAVGEVGRWSLWDREPLDRWSTARTTLLGDAAHPMLPHHGQGANQAIEDAIALAACLARTPRGPHGPAAALDDYERLRRPHTRRVQLGSRDGGSMRLGGDAPAPASAAAPAGRPREGSAAALGSMVEDVGWVQRYDVEAALADA